MQRLSLVFPQYPELKLRVKRAGNFGAPRVDKKGKKFKKILAQQSTRIADQLTKAAAGT